ncbi:beta-lactam-binding protein with PASTA domain [Chitinophaga skermanii]|uniref:Beta-lactam-binding protein with PASTA domain n=1 Tax=Chitinophaga skermanii TaxID=331697 RepID=A0A327QL22_9BACT|nr:PASTA domain-containing protein [Chitinophaga skermanii]RAJ05239.1 beta-lactam-binding protein with PASTA domain [Chitinophaga skermanii]
MFDFITKRSFVVNLLAAIALAVVLALIFFGSLGFLTRHGESITVPDVRGKNIKEATEALEKMGFEVEVRDSIFIDTIPPLTVWEQAPSRGEVVKVNRTIYLTINKVEPPMVAMPELEGLTFRSAEMTLHSRRLNVGDTIYKPDIATNSVLKQMLNGKPIKAGAMVPEGSAITLILSSGPGNYENPVPALIGLTFVEAKALLAGSNLNLGTVLFEGSVSDTANAFIIRQSPSTKNAIGDPNMIRAGMSVDVWISSTAPEVDSSEN